MPIKVTGGKGSDDSGSIKAVAAGLRAHAENTAFALGADSHAEGTAYVTGQSAHGEGSAQASGQGSHGEGGGIASGLNAHAEGSAYAIGTYSHGGGKYASAFRYGQFARTGERFVSVGDAQVNLYTVMESTTTATPSELTASDGAPNFSGDGSTNVWTIPASRAHRVRIEAIAKRTDVAGEHAGWTITCTVVRDATGNARFLVAPTVVFESEGAASAWTLVASINTGNATNNYLALTATGEAGKTIRWVAALYTTEVG